MAEQIEWKAEVSFKGNEREFNNFVEAISAHHVEVSILRWPWPFPFPGLPIFKYVKSIPKHVMEGLIEGSTEITIRHVEGIDGGLRTPHVHLGDKIHLLNKEKFSEYMGELGRVMASSIANEAGGDHVVAMERLSRLDDSVKRIGEMEGIREFDVGR